MMYQIRFVLVWLGLALLGGCEEGVKAPVATAGTRFPLVLGEKAFVARLALDDAERQKGLMYVESMPEDEGMLFLFKAAGPQGFWMKNTLIPLDIGYFSGDGVLREVHRMYPRNLESVKSRGGDIQYCLEMNQGWYRKNGIVPGVRLDMALLAKALRERGEGPVDWGIRAGNGQGYKK